MMFAQIDASKALELVDRASVATDRWLFLAALGLIIVGGVCIIRWLVKSLEEKDAVHQLQLVESRNTFLEALRQQRVDYREELALERSTTAKMADTVQRFAAQFKTNPLTS